MNGRKALREKMRRYRNERQVYKLKYKKMKNFMHSQLEFLHDQLELIKSFKFPKIYFNWKYFYLIKSYFIFNKQ